MRRWSAALLALVAIVVVAFVAENFSNTKDDGSALRARLVSPVVAPGPMAPASSDGCVLDEIPEDLDAAFKVSVAGGCDGTILGELACGENEEVFNGSAAHGVTNGDQFFLTVFIPEFTGPGEYDNAELFAQLSGSSSARWTVRGTNVVVDGEEVHFTEAQLEAEPGTATTGSITLTGDMSC